MPLTLFTSVKIVIYNSVMIHITTLNVKDRSDTNSRCMTLMAKHTNTQMYAFVFLTPWNLPKVTYMGPAKSTPQWEKGITCDTLAGGKTPMKGGYNRGFHPEKSVTFGQYRMEVIRSRTVGILNIEGCEDRRVNLFDGSEG